MLLIFQTGIYLLIVFVFLYIFTDLIENYRENESFDLVLRYDNDLCSSGKCIKINMDFIGYTDVEKEQIIQELENMTFKEVIEKVNIFKIS